MPSPKQLNTYLSVFIFVFWFSSPSRKVWTPLCKRNGFFIAWMDWGEWLRLCRSFVNPTEWRERRVTRRQPIGDIKHTWKNIVFCTCVRCYVPFSQGWKSLHNTVVYMINTCKILAYVFKQYINCASTYEKTKVGACHNWSFLKPRTPWYQYTSDSPYCLTHISLLTIKENFL